MNGWMWIIVTHKDNSMLYAPHYQLSVMVFSHDNHPSFEGFTKVAVMTHLFWWQSVGPCQFPLHWAGGILFFWMASRSLVFRDRWLQWLRTLSISFNSVGMAVMKSHRCHPYTYWWLHCQSSGSPLQTGPTERAGAVVDVNIDGFGQNIEPIVTHTVFEASHLVNLLSILSLLGIPRRTVSYPP